MPIQCLRLILPAPAALAASALPAAADPIRIVAFGDSLTAGLGLDAGAAFTRRLEAALHGRDVVIADAGVSGDNDALRGVDPAVKRGALDRLPVRLSEHRLPARRPRPAPHPWP